MNIFYIVGYGRSGSTLLDRILGANEGIVSCGEIAYFFNAYENSEHRCSCGAPLSDCPLWGDAFAQKWEQANASEQLMHVIEDRLGKRAAIVDSSKTAYGQMLRPFRLRSQGHTVMPILIWRDPKEVMKSRVAARIRTGRIERANSVSLYQAIAGSIGWSLANLAGLWSVYRLNGKIVEFTYFSENRSRVSNQIIEHSEFELFASPIEGDHVAVGNRMRGQDTGDHKNDSKRPDMDGATGLLISAMCFPISVLLRRCSGTQS